MPVPTRETAQRALANCARIETIPGHPLTITRRVICRLCNTALILQRDNIPADTPYVDVVALMIERFETDTLYAYVEHLSDCGLQPANPSLLREALLLVIFATGGGGRPFYAIGTDTGTGGSLTGYHDNSGLDRFAQENLSRPFTAEYQQQPPPRYTPNVYTREINTPSQRAFGELRDGLPIGALFRWPPPAERLGALKEPTPPAAPLPRAAFLYVGEDPG